MRELKGQECRCPTCHRIFRSITGFDTHRKGPPTAKSCMTDPELAEAGYTYRPPPADHYLKPSTDTDRKRLDMMKVVEYCQAATLS